VWVSGPSWSVPRRVGVFDHGLSFCAAGGLFRVQGRRSWPPEARFEPRIPGPTLPVRATEAGEVAPLPLAVVKSAPEEVAGLCLGVEGEGAGSAFGAADERFDGPGDVTGEADVSAGDSAVASVPPAFEQVNHVARVVRAF
jgi:hypothetical protein